MIPGSRAIRTDYLYLELDLPITDDSLEFNFFQFYFFFLAELTPIAKFSFYFLLPSEFG